MNRLSLPFPQAFVFAMAIAGVGLGADSGQAPQAQTPPRPAQQAPAQAPAAQPRQSPRSQVTMDPERARRLYVSKDPKDQSLGTNYQADMAAREKDAARVSGALQGDHRLHDCQVPEQRGRHGHSRLPVSAAEEARREGTRGDGVGARRGPRQLGH